MKSGTIFDNFLITDDEKFAEEFGNETWGATKVRWGVGWGSNPNGVATELCGGRREGRGLGGWGKGGLLCYSSGTGWGWRRPLGCEG